MSRKDLFLQDLFLRHRFTTRGGDEAYEIYTAADAKTQKNCLGSVRLPPVGINVDRVTWCHDRGVDIGGPEQLELPLAGENLND